MQTKPSSSMPNKGSGSSLGEEHIMDNTLDDDFDLDHPFPTPEELERINRFALRSLAKPPSEQVLRTIASGNRLDNPETQAQQILHNQITKELREIRETLGHSREDLAAAIGSTREMVFFLERGLATHNELQAHIRTWIDALNAFGANLDPQEYQERISKPQRGLER